MQKKPANCATGYPYLQEMPYTQCTVQPALFFYTQEIQKRHTMYRTRTPGPGGGADREIRILLPG
jgi:hypothetical protein